MRTFSSYGPISTRVNYYAPREKLIKEAYLQLVGEIPEEGGHYITVWAPRQTGKTWVMIEILNKLRNDPRFYVAKIDLQIESHDTLKIVNYIFRDIGEQIGNKFPRIKDI